MTKLDARRRRWFVRNQLRLGMPVAEINRRLCVDRFTRVFSRIAWDKRLERTLKEFYSGVVTRLLNRRCVFARYLDTPAPRSRR